MWSNNPADNAGLRHCNDWDSPCFVLFFFTIASQLLFSAETYARTIQENLDYLHKEVKENLHIQRFDALINQKTHRKFDIMTFYYKICFLIICNFFDIFLAIDTFDDTFDDLATLQFKFKT